MLRVAPLSAPYPAEIQATFDKIMPAGFDPLVLFRTLRSMGVSTSASPPAACLIVGF